MKFEHTVFCYILREFDTSSPHGYVKFTLLSTHLRYIYKIITRVA